MQYVYLKFDLNITNLLEIGEVVLYGRTGIKYVHKALFVPGYGWVPCSKALCDKFTNDPKHLVLVISEEEDNNRPVTSDIWIARTDLTLTLGNKLLLKKNKTIDSSNKIEVKNEQNVKAFNRMGARALVIKENDVLKFVETYKKDINGEYIRDNNGQPIKNNCFYLRYKKRLC